VAKNGVVCGQMIVFFKNLRKIFGIKCVKKWAAPNFKYHFRDDLKSLLSLLKKFKKFKLSMILKN
jgi:hypothetical protein